MARIRYLKPDFFKDEDIANLHPWIRLLYQGLWTLADKEGRLEDRPMRIKVEVFPYDKVDIEKGLAVLSSHKANSNKPFIVRYQAEGVRYIQIVNWHKHQKPHHLEAPSTIPSPDGYLIIDEMPPSEKIRHEIYARDGYTCVYCKANLTEEPHRICLDHIVPISRNGSNSRKNLATSCKKCNALKSDCTPEEVGFTRPSGLGEERGQEKVDGVSIVGDTAKSNAKPETAPLKKFAEFVEMTEEQYKALVTEYGLMMVKTYIAKVSHYCGASGKKYKRYDCVVRQFLMKDGVKKVPPPPKPTIPLPPEERVDPKEIHKLAQSLAGKMGA